MIRFRPSGRSAALCIPAAASLWVVGVMALLGNRDSMWVDEVFSYWMTTRSFGGLVRELTRYEANMAPYYAALWLWARVGQSDLWLRSFSALGTIAAVWAIWSIVRRWGGTVAAGLAVGVFVLSPFVMLWSLQTRGYSWTMAFAAWSLVLLDRVLDRPRAVIVVALGVMLGLTMALQFTAALSVIGLIVAAVILAPHRRSRRAVLMAVGIAGIVLLPFASVGLLHPDQASWIPAFSLDLLGIQLGQLVNGPIWIGMILVGFALVVVGVARRRVERRTLIALTGAVTGVVGLVVVSLLARSMFISRYMAACVPLAVIAAAVGWGSVRRWIALAVPAVALVSILTLVMYADHTRSPSPQDFRGAARQLRAEMRDGDAFIPKLAYLDAGLRRYWRGSSTSRNLVDLGKSDLDGGSALVSTGGSAVGADRLWVLVGGRADAPLPDPDRFGLLLDRYPNVVEHTDFGSLALELRTR